MTDAELMAEIEATPARRGARVVAIPGVGNVEFPGTMADEEIAQASRRLYAQGGGRSAPSEAEMVADLAKADAAGDTKLASAIADRIRAARVQQRPTPGQGEAGFRGALQGATFGFGDEASAAVDAALPWLSRKFDSAPLAGAPEGATFRQRYEAARDYYRNRNAAAERANPGTYLAGQVTGAAVAPGGAVGAGTKGAKALSAAVGQGAVAGAGYSDADLLNGDVGRFGGDVAKGGAFGAGGWGLGAVLRRSMSALARRGAERQALATARAGAQAAEDVAAPIQSAAGALGGETQKGSRYVENLMRLESSMTPEQRALYAQLQAQGIVPDLQRAVAQGTLEALPGQAATIAAKRAELEALQRAAPQAVAGRTAELMTPQVGADARSLWRSYGEPVAAAYLGYKAADLAGADSETKAGAAALAGLMFGRTRAGKALRTRINRPAHQAAIGRAEQNIGDSAAVDALVAILRRGVPAVATDATVSGDEARAQAELDRLLSQ